MKIPQEAFVEELTKAGLNDSQIKDLLKILAEKNISKLNLDGAEDLKQLFKYLEQLGKKDFIEFDPYIARGLAYYTGIVFECFDRKGELRAIFAGGRYDKMIEQLGGQPCPATGFAIGDVTTQLILESNNIWPKPNIGVDYFIAPMSNEVLPFALKVLEKVRKNNSADIDLIGRKLDKQLSYASSIKAKKAIIIGEEEVKTKKLTVKDLETGKQEKISFEKI
jgi:histidyl-tRNA synthetase